MEYFQDDLFPKTKKTTVATMNAGQWFGGDNKPMAMVSLRPSDMKPRKYLLSIRVCVCVCVCAQSYLFCKRKEMFQ